MTFSSFYTTWKIKLGTFTKISYIGINQAKNVDVHRFLNDLHEILPLSRHFRNPACILPTWLGARRYLVSMVAVQGEKPDQ